jgi:hypothetical protein
MMSRGQVTYLQLTVAGVTLTGIVFAWMKYAMKPHDEFAVINHPLQPHMLSAHVLIAPLAVFAFGWTFANHIWPAFVNRAPNRASGIAAMLLIAPMAISGYLMQVTTGDALRHAWAVTHWITSGVFVVAYVVHLIPRGAQSDDPDV